MKYARILMVALLAIVAVTACRQSKQKDEVVPCDGAICFTYNTNLNFRLINAATKEDLVFSGFPMLKQEKIFITNGVTVNGTLLVATPGIVNPNAEVKKYLSANVQNLSRPNLTMRLEFNSGLVKELNITTDLKRNICCGATAEHVWMDGKEYTAKDKVVDIPVNIN